ncbi:maltase 2-like [Sitophilus oryzae]|uniref:alpha-glucosidase n=1 Tax=Sitophilus oryzae TaxID=7048 RepID=A0A6J2YY21_SITOR|nr:maltase 2-like [Sitophilus oryzae]
MVWAGIIQKLDFIQTTGIDAIWLSPIFKSPQVDNGYDISDYRDIDEMYGSLDDLKQLVEEAHKRGIKVILDYVPNHTSDQHKWFQASLNKESGYEDFYVWKDAVIVNGTRSAPNNWVSEFKGTAWEWSEQRQQYYLHKFSIAQPDLNYRNPDVVKEMKDVLRYWLDFGVDGFRMDVAYALFEDSRFQDEPLSGDPTAEPGDYTYLSHIYTENQNETLDMIYQFREFLDEYNANQSYPRVLMTEVYSDINTTMLYFGTADRSRLGAHFTFNFWTFITGLQKGFSGVDLLNSIWNWIDHMPEGYTSNWVLGNHDQNRVSTRFGPENIDALNMLVSILPGVQVTYNGEEIGQENGEVTCAEGYDPQAIKNCSTFNETSRDFERTPIQWDSTVNAGFNNGTKPWLPVSQKYLQTNLQNQNVTGPGVNSHYKVYKDLLSLRKAFKNESNHYFELSNAGDILGFQRFTEQFLQNYVFLYNVGDEPQTPENINVYNFTTNVLVRSTNSIYNVGDAFNTSQPLQAKEAVLFSVY